MQKVKANLLRQFASIFSRIIACIVSRLRSSWLCVSLSASRIWSELQSQRFRNRLKLQSQGFRSQKEVCGRIPVLRLESFVILPGGRLNLLRPHYLLWCRPCDMRPLSASTFIGLSHARRCQFTRGCSVCRGCCRHDEHFRNICNLTQLT